MYYNYELYLINIINGQGIFNIILINIIKVLNELCVCVQITSINVFFITMMCSKCVRRIPRFSDVC